MDLFEAVSYTYAAVGQEITDGGLKIICSDLEGYPLGSVLTALSRCRKELRRIALADILERIPGGHPGPEEAWSIVAKALTDERATIVWTEEIRQAFGIALGLQDDPIAARMAFKEVYARLVAESREQKKMPMWSPSLGQDPAGREHVLAEAASKGRLTDAQIYLLLPHWNEPPEGVLALLKGVVK